MNPIELFKPRHFQQESFLHWYKKWILGFAIVFAVILIIVITAMPSTGKTKLGNIHVFKVWQHNNLHHVVNNIGYLLVTVGYPWSNETQSTEVIDLDNPDNKCDNLQPFPIGVQGATGHLVYGNTPVICGGLFSNESSSNKCYIFGNPTPVLTMHEERWHPASLLLDEGRTIWIVGGRKQEDHDSSEILDTFRWTTEPGPSMPDGLAGHSLVQIDSNKVMLIGGHDGSVSHNTTWFFDFRSKNWTRGPDLNIGRASFAYGLIRDSSTGSDLVIVSGGLSNSHHVVNSTEMWVVDSDQWKMGPGLPFSFYGAAGVVTADGKSLILIGGGNAQNYRELDTLYRLQCFNLDCEWTMMEQKLKVARDSMVAMLIPEANVTCSID